MNKISVGETILRGYGFAARRLLANVGLTWLTAAFYAVAVCYWVQQLCTTMLVSPHPGSELNDFAIFDLVCLVVVTALGTAMIARALTGEALERGHETMTAYLALARREWALFLSLLRLYIFVIGALALVIFGGIALIAMALPTIGANMQWHGITALTAMNVAVAVIAFGAMAILAIRLGFFAAPVASAERSASLTRTWRLSSGNSWRLFAVAVAMTLPVLLLWAVAIWVLIGGQVAGALAPALSVRHDSTALYQLIESNAPAVAIAWTILVVALNMLFAGASAFAYDLVRNDAAISQTRTMPSVPMLEPAFAGSFAGFAPRFAKELASSDMETAPPPEALPEFSAVNFDEEADAPVLVEPVATDTIETVVPEPPLVDPQISEASTMNEGVAETEAAPVHVEQTHVAEITGDDHSLEAVPNEQAPESAPVFTEESAEHAVVAAETAPNLQFPFGAETEATPPPSHDDATEFSPPNVPSEAA